MSTPAAASNALPESAERHAEALAQNLEQQTGAYRDYAAQLEHQRRALISGNLQALAEANAAIDAVVSGLLQFEVDRESLVRLFLEEAGLRAPDAHAGWFTRMPEKEAPMKCEAIAAHLRPESAARLLRARDSLKKVLAEVKVAARVARALAENGQKLVLATIASLTSLSGGEQRPKHSLYTRHGYTQIPPRRQVRSLVNRKA